MARALGIFGSIDANRGDQQNGWDTDQFPNSVEELTLAMLEIIRAGGFTNGGFNFDAKVRRQSIDAADLFHGHIGGIDTVARALLRSAAIIEDGSLDGFRAQRYAGWTGEVGKAIHAPDATLASVADMAIQSNRAPEPRSLEPQSVTRAGSPPAPWRWRAPQMWRLMGRRAAAKAPRRP